MFISSSLLTIVQGDGAARKLILTKTRHSAAGAPGEEETGRIVSSAGQLDDTKIKKPKFKKHQMLTLLDRTSFKLWLCGSENGGVQYDGMCTVCISLSLLNHFVLALSLLKPSITLSYPLTPALLSNNQF